MDDKKENNRIFSKVIAGLILYTFFLIAIFTAKFSILEVSNDVSKWGSVGDYFGGLLNPILAFSSFIGVLWTLKMSREELIETREVMDEQLKTQSLQQFDSLFSTLISELSKKNDHLYPNKVKELNDKIFKKYEINENKRQLIIDDHNFSVFFIFLYQLLKLIDTSLTDEITKKKYANIVRSLIPDEILQLLMINCYLDTKEHNFDKYKKLLEDFEFFEHISLYDNKNLLKTSLLLSVSTSYKSKAFGHNGAYKAFNENIIFNKLGLTHYYL